MNNFDWDVHFDGQPGWLPARTIFLTVHGSHAYGTNIETSDIDYRGICIAPKEYYFGFTQHFENKVQTKPDDLTVFELRKFLSLAANANPNALEILFTDPSEHRIITPAGQILLDNRDLFLSRKCKHTFSGYALSQLKRIKTHKAWIDNKPECAPIRSDFDLPSKPDIKEDQLKAAMSAINKQLDSWSIDFLDNLDPDLRIVITQKMSSHLAEMGISSGEEFAAAARLIGLTENFIHMLDKERRYNAAVQHYKQFLGWQRERNLDRAELESKFGYDCYADGTEFLTDEGWKSYDSISANDKLATVFIRRNTPKVARMEHRVDLFGIEYQAPTHKFDAQYNGPMYQLTGHHLDCLVTANHRMLFQKEERRTGVQSSWILEEVSELPDTFNVLIAPTPRKKTYSNRGVFADIPIASTAYLTLMGWYLSDGCATFYKESVKSIRISQDLHGKLSRHMTKWHNQYSVVACSSLYEYERDPNEYNSKKHMEKILDVRLPEIADKLVQECGHTDSKRVPRYAFGLSRRLLETLLNALIKGDGTRREHKTKNGSFIYYSKSKLLADDIQELGVMAGWETALWGPYAGTDQTGRVSIMYQVHLRPVKSRQRKLIRSSNVERIEVRNQRVVCFSVPNGTLVTRRNGKISIHGNCKHGMHLARLLRSCRELLTDGKMKVRRPDAEELKGIRRGEWSYERLVTWAEQENKALDDLMLKSPLPKEPDQDRIDELCIQLVQESF